MITEMELMLRLFLYRLLSNHVKDYEGRAEDDFPSVRGNWFICGNHQITASMIRRKEFSGHPVDCATKPPKDPTVAVFSVVDEDLIQR